MERVPGTTCPHNKPTMVAEAGVVTQTVAVTRLKYGVESIVASVGIVAAWDRFWRHYEGAAGAR
jgi:hypothetical protein